jgi:hypothetical protein
VVREREVYRCLKGRSRVSLISIAYRHQRDGMFEEIRLQDRCS